MLSANSSILYADPSDMPHPEQIDGWLSKQVPGGRVFPRPGLGAAYCLWGRVHGVRPEVLVAQGAQECYFYREYENEHWMRWNNPASMVYYAGRFTACDCIPGRDSICAQPTPWDPVAPRAANREHYFARFTTMRHGIKAHCCLARDYAEKGHRTVEQFLNAWGTGQAAKIVAWANEIRAYPRLPAPGIRDEYTQYALTALVGRGIMRGYPDGYLHDEWPLTRAEMVVFLMRAFGNTALWRKKKDVATPPDVAGHWAEEEIRRAMQAGWMSGFRDGRFRPDDFLTRAQTCSTLGRISGLFPLGERKPPALADVANHWARDDILWAYRNGWLGEFVELDIYGGRRFLPDFPISRGEMAHLLWQLIFKQFPQLLISGTAPQRLVPAVWVGTEKKWVPAWAVPLFVGEREAWEQPVTMVPADVVEPWPRTVLRNPALIAAVAAAGVAAGMGTYYLLKRGF